MSPDRIHPMARAARDLAVAVHLATRPFPSQESGGLATSLRGAASSLAMRLEAAAAGRLALRLETCLTLLWRFGHQVDIAERLGYLVLGDAVELLELGSHVEVELVQQLTEDGWGEDELAALAEEAAAAPWHISQVAPEPASRARTGRPLPDNATSGALVPRASGEPIS